MKEKSLPKPNTQALSWFYGESKKGNLILDPKYQRNPIWSIGQKCFLIDSLISGSPIPQVFINIKTKTVSKVRQTDYEVVDGQQRLRAILEFMEDQYPLIKTTAKSYPVSGIYAPHIGKKYSELPSELQDAIWNYPLAVQELRDWTDVEIRALFRRLNYVVEKLNKQELRHSQYFGEFVIAAEELSKDPFWDEIDFFSRHDSQRMKDVEFVSELLVLLMDGPQEGQSTLDRFYADYDVLFPKKKNYLSKFHQTLRSLKSIETYLASSRFVKKADFYALFGAVSSLNELVKQAVNLSYAENELSKFENQLSKSPESLTGKVLKYYNTVIEGPAKKAKREERIKILSGLVAKD
ncbi:MAG TPA: DUF262 domain-containing protein [Candidatus Paceibacterota bacterium]|nr:DUF262 domain-containing protein [Candidatus Paceibacterota bacterium]